VRSLFGMLRGCDRCLGCCGGAIDFGELRGAIAVWEIGGSAIAVWEVEGVRSLFLCVLCVSVVR
jgi:hypothetical protein